MVLSVAAHLSMASELVGNQITPRQFINECKYLLRFADDSNFQKGLSMAGSSVRHCFPILAIEAAATDCEPVARFLENTLLPTIEKLSQ